MRASQVRGRFHCAMLLVGTAVAGLTSQKLLDRGLTRREVECLEHRHRRRNNKQRLTEEELDETLLALDERALLPGQARHLLRSVPLPELRQLCAAHTSWCSYRKTLCDCDVAPLSTSPPPAAPTPRVLAFDCVRPPRPPPAPHSDRLRVVSRVVCIGVQAGALCCGR